MTIESLHVKNFRCFSDLQIDFDPKLTVLVGVNGAGKSAVLDALAIILKAFANSFRDNEIRIMENIYISNPSIGFDSFYYSVKLKGADGAEVPAIEALFNEDRISSLLKVDLAQYIRPLNTFWDTYAEHGKLDKAMPVFTYYSAKRILPETKNSNSGSINKASAYTDAFSPAIDFQSTMNWFVNKSTEEALHAKKIKNFDYEIAELKAVREAVLKALNEEYQDPQIDKTPPEFFVCKKDTGEMYSLTQLSDGYRTMLALVMDLARRMAVANDKVTWLKGESVLHSPGTVLIDEIELHLHPSWQQTVLPTLMNIFPNIQFIVTTHSPQTLTSIEPEYIRILKDGKAYCTNVSTFGAENSRVLQFLQEVLPRPHNDATKTLENYFSLLRNGGFEEAEKLREKLNVWMRDDPVLDRADMLLLRMKRKKEREDSNAQD